MSGVWSRAALRPKSGLEMSADWPQDELIAAWSKRGNEPISKMEFRQHVRKLLDKPNVKEVDMLFESLDDDKGGSLDAHEMRMLAQGHVDFVLSAGLTPWDHAAGALLCQCAGGHVAMLDGSDYNAAKREGYLLCAANLETWERIRDAMSFLLDTPAATAVTDDEPDEGPSEAPESGEG